MRRWPRRLAIGLGVVAAVGLLAVVGIRQADGPVWLFGGGPFRSGDWVEFDALDWNTLDALHELEFEIVAAGSSRILWFNVHDGVSYLICDLDCIGGRLPRWPQQIERDNRVVVRIEGKRVEGKLVHVPHGTAEYKIVRAIRAVKYVGDEGNREAAETAAHGLVVDVGEKLTGRDQREEPGDRMYRLEPR
ncbi:MAG: hypothetical protein AAF430_19610 [Myxococcota bacterium]